MEMISGGGAPDFTKPSAEDEEKVPEVIEYEESSAPSSFQELLKKSSPNRR